jgi:hypothetical protein
VRRAPRNAQQRVRRQRKKVVFGPVSKAVSVLRSRLGTQHVRKTRRGTA